MEGTIGEIRMFGGNFAPAGWQFCNGQSMSIAEYTALYAVIGTNFGGDGQTSFVLPDLRSRIPVGTGQGPGLPAVSTGEAWGEEGVTLTTSQMPTHTHNAVVSGGGGAATFTATLNGVNNIGGVDNPTGNILGQDTVSSSTSYATSGTLSEMNAGSVVVTNLYAPLPTISVGAAGGSLPHSNIQPVLALNYIICTEGIFPSRN